MIDAKDHEEHAHPPEGRELDSLLRARRSLLRKIEHALSGANGHASHRVVRLSERVEGSGVSPLWWMLSCASAPRGYWSGREDGREVAFCGSADVADSGASVPPLPEGARYYGGTRFDPGSEVAPEWSSFGASRFYLPRFELVSEGGESYLVCNLVLPRDAGNGGEISLALEPAEPSGPPREGSERERSGVFARRDEPAFDGWRSGVERALRGFEAGEVEKVVLARRVVLGFEGDPAALFAALARAAPGCFHFYLEPEPGRAFLGATPERLYRREGRRISSEAVAGTRPRAQSASDDEEFSEELLASEKDRAEHGYVRAGIEEDLSPLCESFEIERGVSEMKLASRRHLVSRSRGTLREGVTDSELLTKLHPTPAVGGYPNEAARRFIGEIEPFDRGWYAGAVGWISSDSAEFAVGIRSALSYPEGSTRKLALFSGAGIVPGSVPESEWDEIEQKITDFAGILGLEHSREHAVR